MKWFDSIFLSFGNTRTPKNARQHIMHFRVVFILSDPLAFSTKSIKRNPSEYLHIFHKKHKTQVGPLILELPYETPHFHARSSSNPLILGKLTTELSDIIIKIIVF